MTDVATLIGTIVAASAVIGGLALWAIRSTVAPLSVVIDNNTKALDRVTVILDEHTEKLEDHKGRIIAIEVRHEREDRP